MSPKVSKKKWGPQRDLEALVVGGGSFGTAIGSILARNKRKVKIWVRQKEHADEINKKHTNENYFPGLKLSKDLTATTDLKAVVPRAQVIIMAIPSKGFRQVSREVGDGLSGDQIIVHVTKGIEPKTFKRMSEILREETCALKIGAISGPTLAKELMADYPAGALVASHFNEVVHKTQALFEKSTLRLYGGKDVVGTETGGAFKNIIALMSGAAAGMGFGDNTKALIITRGLSEMAQYGVSLGADVFTFGGLAGIGDLMATCNSPLSRNHQVGRRLAAGETLDDIIKSTTQVAEGVSTTKVVYNQSKVLKLDLPLVTAVYDVLYKNMALDKIFTRLMEAPPEREMVRLVFG